MGNSCFGEEDPSLLNDPLLGGALPVAERLSVDGKRGGSLSGDGSVGNPVIAERLSNEILYSSKKGERVVKQERFENGDVDNKVDPKTEKYSFECGKRSQADYLQFALVLSTYMPRAVQRRRQLFCDL